MRQTERGSTMLWIAMAACLFAAAGCTTTKDVERQKYAERERVLASVKEGQDLATSSPLVALSRFDRAVKLHPTADAWYQMGRLYEGMGRRNEAAAAYNEAIKLSPDWREARFALLALGFEPPTAATPAEIREARQWAARNPVPHVTLPSTAAADQAETGTQETEDLEAKRQDVIKSAVENRQPTEAEVAAAIFAPRREQEPVLPSAEKPTYSKEEDLVIGSYPYHMDRARVFSDQGRIEAAIDEYQRAMQIDPGQIDPRLAMGDLMMRDHRDLQARFYYEEARKRFPDSPRPDLKLGNLALQMKQRDLAAEYFRKALEKDPRYAEALNNLGVMAMEDKNYAEATRLFDQALAMRPDYPNALLNRGIIAGDVEHDTTTALRMYRRYVELKGPSSQKVQRWIQQLEARKP